MKTYGNAKPGGDFKLLAKDGFLTLRVPATAIEPDFSDSCIRCIRNIFTQKNFHVPAPFFGEPRMNAEGGNDTFREFFGERGNARKIFGTGGV